MQKTVGVGTGAGWSEQEPWFDIALNSDTIH